jgi:hypothetical protein
MEASEQFLCAELPRVNVPYAKQHISEAYHRSKIYLTTQPDSIAVASTQENGG